GQEAGADFILQGTINTLVDELEDAKAVVYQVDLELVDIASNVKVWLGQKKVKKLVERSKATL
ncbi:MAG TPA: penicillin-binding protein activator LpoB, partial [Candidatus Bathyarchaeia archaeon]|nr:penicillin-binding protein activator LpoB [Candidatus Bathyarchaeia archaeon]